MAAGIYTKENAPAALLAAYENAWSIKEGASGLTYIGAIQSNGIIFRLYIDSKKEYQYESRRLGENKPLGQPDNYKKLRKRR